MQGGVQHALALPALTQFLPLPSVSSPDMPPLGAAPGRWTAIESSSSANPSDAPEQTEPPQPAPKKKYKRIMTTRRREQCRTNQARYRAKRRDVFQDLQKSVTQLHAEIKMLELRRRNLWHNVDNTQSPWSVVVEYFRHFRYGVPEAELIGNSLVVSETQNQQRNFLESTMAPQVHAGGLYGVEAFFEQWKRYSSWYGNIKLELQRMEKLSSETIDAQATLYVTVTERTLRYIFPHLLGHASTDLLALGDRLRGRRLECPCTLSFEWNDTSSQVVCLDIKLDLVKPLLHVLGDLVSVARVLEHAMISPENAIGELDAVTPSVASIQPEAVVGYRREGSDVYSCQ